MYHIQHTHYISNCQNNAVKGIFFTFLLSLLLSACGGGSGGNNASSSAASLESISLSGVDATLDLNETRQLIITGLYSDASTANLGDQVNWVVDNPDILTINSAGLLTPRAAGTTLVTASINDLTAQVLVTVRALAQLSLTPGAVTLAINSSQSISVTGLYTDNSTEPLDALVTWSSNNSQIATVSETGVIKGLTEGSTQVNAEYAGLSRALTVTVSPATLQAITLSAAESQVPAGLTASLLATGLYSDGTEQNLTDQVQWSVSDSEFAQIDSATGVLTGLQAGTFKVIASKEGLSGKLDFTVTPALLEELQLNPASLTLAKGTSQSVVVTAVFSDASKQDVSEQVLWNSSDPGKAIVAEGSSKIEALALGTVQLSASLLDQDVSLTLTVSDAELVSLALWPANAKRPLGVSQQFIAQGYYTDDSVQDLTNAVTWLSSNEDAAIIANSESQKGEMQSLEVGTTVIKAVLADIQQTTSLAIEDTSLASIEIQPINQTVASGTDAQVKAIGHYANGARFDITNIVKWTTASSNLISLSQAKTGTVKTLAAGDVIINAALQGVTSFARVNVTDAVLQSIAIESSTSRIADQSRLQLVARAYYSDLSDRDISRQVTWQSSDSEVLSVTNDAGSAGVIEGMKPGVADITASLGQISGERQYRVSDAVLTKIQLASPESSLNVNGSMQATAQASYSDGSVQDVTRQVNWLSSSNLTASVDNTDQNKGTITALAAGEVQIRAILGGLESEPLDIQVTENANTPLSLNISMQPNVILNNASDASEVSINVLPAKAGGKVADGTQLVLLIKEGELMRTETLSTVDGVARYTLSSEYNGLVELTASTADLSVDAGLLSAEGLWEAISVRGYADVSYAEEKLKQGSIFLASLRNLSNRPFEIAKANIQYLDSLRGNRVTQFEGSPFTAPEFISEGNLEAAEFTYLGYELDFDIQAKIYQIIYLLSEPDTNSAFTLGVEFDFAELTAE